MDALVCVCVCIPRGLPKTTSASCNRWHHHQCKDCLCQWLKDKCHQCNLQSVTTAMCASGLLVLVDKKDNTTSARCKGQVARCKGQDNISPSVRVAVSVTQAGVTCTSSCELHSLKVATEKRNHNLAPELVAYTLRRSFSNASHQCGHDSLSPIAVYTVTGGPHYCATT